MTDCDYRHQYPTTSLLRPIRFLLFICGSYVPPKLARSASFRIIRSIFLIVVTTGLFFLNGMTCMAYYYEPKFSSRATWILCAMVLSFESLAASCFLIWWERKKSIKKILSELRSATSERGIANNINFHKIVCGFVIFIVLIMWASVTAGLAIFRNHRLELVLNLEFLDEIYFAACVYACGCYLHANALFILVCQFIYAEVKFFNKEIKKSISIDNEKMETLIKSHVHLAGTIDQANRTFGFYIFIMMAASLPAIILLAYDILTADEVEFSRFLMLLLAMSTVQLLTLTLGPASIYEETVRTAQILYTKLAGENVWVNGQGFRIASWLTSQANSQLGLNAGGFFVITKSLVLTAVSLIVSYLMLLIQFNPDKPQSWNNGSIAKECFAENCSWIEK